MRQVRLQHRFVEFIPEALEAGVLYVSMEYMAVAHKCCCGCGSDVSTPLSPTDWRLIYDGKTISLEPSIGSWSLPCQSHYWIQNNQIRWAESWTQLQIHSARLHDARVKKAYYCNESPSSPDPAQLSDPAEPKKRTQNWRDRLKVLFQRT